MGVGYDGCAGFDIKVMHAICWLAHPVRRIVQRRCMETHGAQMGAGTASAGIKTAAHPPHSTVHLAFQNTVAPCKRD